MMGMSSPEWSRYMHDVVGVPDPARGDLRRGRAADAERYRERLPLIAGAVEAVRRLAARWPLGLASSSNRRLIDLALELAGIAELFGRRLLGGGRSAASRRRTSTSRRRAGWASHPSAAPRSRTRTTASARRARPGCASSRSRTRPFRRTRRRSRRPTSSSVDRRARARRDRAARGAVSAAPPFTTRPELRGTFGMVASTHWLASAAGMAVLERGGNAFDAAVAAGLRAAGRRAAPERPRRRPAGRLLERRARRAARPLRPGRRRRPRPPSSASASSGLDLVPGHRPARRLRARRVRRLDAAAARLRHAGGSATCWRSRSATPSTAIRSSRGITRDDRRASRSCCADWPASAALYLPAPRAPGTLSATRRSPRPTADRRARPAAASREDEIERARDAFYRGFVAEAIATFCAREVERRAAAPATTWPRWQRDRRAAGSRSTSAG